MGEKSRHSKLGIRRQYSKHAFDLRLVSIEPEDPSLQFLGRLVAQSVGDDDEYFLALFRIGFYVTGVEGLLSRNAFYIPGIHVVDVLLPLVIKGQKKIV